ncbi:AbiH family protein [Flavobacterium sp. ARAG 55.4]|uniref:AbiH family protein n=1 Tax=Flavobacterium sp. ARAG 55.4 TaxID=3451357 RepID=UPI003F455D2E
MRKVFLFMSKILITGNGFDLFHHLPTKYHHFISIMLTIEGIHYDKDVSFEGLFGKVFKKKYQYEYDLIIENYNTENIQFSHEQLNRIKQLLETNLWYKYFKNVMEIDTWIDFEIEIENILNQLEIFNKYQDKKKIERNDFQDSLIKYTNFEVFNIVELFGNVGYFRLDWKYINMRKSVIDLKVIIEDLLKEFESFIIIFNHYLVDVISVFYPELKQKSSVPFHLMDGIYTFNYTPTLENIYNVDKSKVVYLHGKMNEDCQRQNLVLGVSEINDEIKKSKIYGFTKYYQKIKKRTNTKFVNLPHSKNNLEETIFYIIGHSLDASDKEYIFDLFEFLKLDNNKFSRICVFYLNEADYNQKLNNLFSIIDKNTIVNFDKDGRLYFKVLSNENITEQFRKKLTGKRQTGPVWS